MKLLSQLLFILLASVWSLNGQIIELGFNANKPEHGFSLSKVGSTGLTLLLKASTEHQLREAENVISDESSTPFYKLKWVLIFLLFLLVFIVIVRIRIVHICKKFKNQMIEKNLNENNSREITDQKADIYEQISEEFKTPLTLILNPLERLMQQPGEFNQTTYSLIYKNALRLRRLVNQLHDLQKKDVGALKLEVVYNNIVYFIKNISIAFNPLATQRNINYTFTSSVDSLYTWFDPDKMEKVLYNIISNAFKYTSDNGKIDINVEKVEHINGHNLYSEYLEIKIKDNGISIAEESLSLLFNCEEKKNYRSEFNEIGLAISKEFVKLHKGKMSVESRVGKGNCYTIILPFNSESLENNKKGCTETCLNEKVAGIAKESVIFKMDRPVLSGESAKSLPLLLVVEDNEDFLTYLCSELLPFFRVIKATDGNEGLHKAIETIPDLVISDIMMPLMDGIELCDKLKTDLRTSHIPVILLTARSNDENKIEGYQLGADDYITKPFSPELLIVRVNGLIKSRRKLQELFATEPGQINKNVTENPIDAKFLSDIDSIINEHMADTTFGPKELAKFIGMSRTQIYRKLKAITNHTPNDYIQAIRMNKAAEMLLENKYAIYEVAHAIGFTEQSNFTRSFTKKFGLSPTNYIATKTFTDKV